LRQTRSYGALHETQHEIDEQKDTPASEEHAARRSPLRSWTHYGGMVSQQESANKWIRQNNEIRMAANESQSTGREEPAPGATRGEGTQSRQSEQEQDQAELQEARAAVEEAKQREASERGRQQERDRSGPER
jgi:hypothetical protein